MNYALSQLTEPGLMFNADATQFKVGYSDQKTEKIKILVEVAKDDPIYPATLETELIETEMVQTEIQVTEISPTEIMETEISPTQSMQIKKSVVKISPTEMPNNKENVTINKKR
jgi:hypothetical protein